MRAKMIVILIVVFVMFMPFTVVADTAPRAQWTLDVGGNREEVIYDVIQTSDGGYIAAGKTGSMSSSNDVYVVKVTSTGEVEWEMNYGSIKEDYAKSIRQTSDGGYIVGGGTRSFNVGVVDYYVIKLDSSGNVQWEQKFGGSQTDICESVIQTKDGGYMAAGQSWINPQNGDVYIIKLDADGEEEWHKSIGGSLEDGAYDIQQTPDRGYIIAGYTRSAGDGSYDMFIVKTDSDGEEEWMSDFGGNNHDQALSIEQHRDGYIAAGYTKSFSESSDIYVVRLDLDGNEVWKKSYGSSSTDEEARSIMKTSDGGYILVGKTNQYTYGAFDVYLLKLDRNGKEQWAQVFGGENDDYGYSVRQTSDGGYILGGQTKSVGFGGNVYIIKTEAPAGTRTTGDSNLQGIPEYGTPAAGAFAGAMMLMAAGQLLRRRL